MIRTFTVVMQLIRLTDGKKGTTLGKVYGYMLVLDKLYSKPIDGIPERMREKMHKIFMARWAYFHTPLMTAAYILEPEYIRRTFSRDEKIELFRVMASFANDAHTLADLKKEYAQMKHQVDKLLNNFGDDTPWEHVYGMTVLEWNSTYLFQWESLNWFADRLGCVPCSSSKCEHGWSIESWVHSARRNRLTQTTTEHMVRFHSNLLLEEAMNTWDANVLPWEEELFIECAGIWDMDSVRVSGVATDALVIDRNSAPLTVSEEILGDQATTSDSDDNVPLGRVRHRRVVDEDSDDAHWEE